MKLPKRSGRALRHSSQLGVNALIMSGLHLARGKDRCLVGTSQPLPQNACGQETAKRVEAAPIDIVCAMLGISQTQCLEGAIILNPQASDHLLRPHSLTLEPLCNPPA